jgi:hypothetical protein
MGHSMNNGMIYNFYIFGIHPGTYEMAQKLRLIFLDPVAHLSVHSAFFFSANAFMPIF